MQGRVAIVTGAAGGIGSVTARTLAAAGAAVVVADLPGANIDERVEELVGLGHQAIGHAGDVTDEASVAALMEATKAAFGRLDMISNIVGATTYTMQDTLVTKIDADLWDRIIAINVRSAMLTTKHGIPLMLEQGAGAICNTSSGLSFLGDDHSLAYGVSKAGVNTLTKYVATQFGKKGIRCNAVAPGLILTPAARTAMPSKMLEVIEMQTLVPRLGDPQDIANAHKFLLSDAAAFINGEVLSVDGGHRAHQPHVGQIRELFPDLQA